MWGSFLQYTQSHTLLKGDKRVEAGEQGLDAPKIIPGAAYRLVYLLVGAREGLFRSWLDALKPEINIYVGYCAHSVTVCHGDKHYERLRMYIFIFKELDLFDPTVPEWGHIPVSQAAPLGFAIACNFRFRVSETL